MRKKLPLGIQDFEKLIKDNALYVDKTQYIYDLITSGAIYFLSRPRRFGKSLLISTLDALFSGKKELFDGLWIRQNTDYEFPVHPVIRIDMSKIANETGAQYEQGLKDYLQEIADSYQIKLDLSKPLKTCFDHLIDILAKTGKVVILIDEYDKAIIDHLGKDIELAKKNRDIMKQFYGCLKSQDANIRFLLMTGVSKFSKVSVFSDLNHLTDLTMNRRYAGMLGYTQAELECSFIDYFQEISESEGLARQEIFNQMKEWYNGYQFSSDEMMKVYNPFSCLNYFNKKEFSGFWFESGTPTFLVELIKTQAYDFTVLDEYKAEEDMFSVYELENLNILSLLVQTGYLTIKGKAGIRYILGYPNYEVKNGFITHLLKHLTRENTEIHDLIWNLAEALNNEDLELFFDISKQIFLEIPYDIHLKEEKYWQSLWYLIIKMVGLKASAEYRTNRGRVDMVVETSKSVYVFELKINGRDARPYVSGMPPTRVYTPDDAIAQIIKKGYADEFADRYVYFVGVVFDLELKNIKEWKVIKNGLQK